ncbi:MAG: hypothetical protein HY273_17100 [Gammaproteobacteria bacterium]|nr:hypothetical protein [Gammaproteobacteria bacterium]
MRDLWKLAGLLCVMTFLSACSGDSFVASASTSGTPGTGTGGTSPGCTADPTAAGCTTTAGYLTIRSSVQEIKSDAQDIAKITATVLDESRAAIKDVQVTFTAVSASNTSAGKLSSSIAFTDETGAASVDFSAASDNPANGVVYVRAAITGLSAVSVPITIKGTTLTLSTTQTMLIVTGASITQSVTVVAKDAAGLGVYNVPISFTIAGNSGGTTAAPGGAALSSSLVTTDSVGMVKVTLTGVSSGDVYLTASGLGTSTQQKFTVQNVALDNPFRITAPTPVAGTNYTTMYANGSTTAFTVTADASKLTAAAGVRTVRFVSTIGSWSAVTGTSCGSACTDVVFSSSSGSGTATATLVSNAGDHGFATVYVVDLNNPDTFASMSVAMSPPVSNAAQTFIQSDLNVLPLKTTTTDYEANLTATVVTSNASGNFPIYQVPVQFTLQHATGGGEEITKSFGLTDVYGVVKTTLKSGVSPSGQNAVTVKATVLSPTTVTTTLSAALPSPAIATTLAAAIPTTTATSIDVASIAGFSTPPPGFIVVIGSEQMLVTSFGAPTTTWTVVRGYNGSTAATHLIGASVDYYGTTVAVASNTAFPTSNFVVLVDSEKMLVNTTPNNNSWVVTRGYGGTNPAAHASGATVTFTPDISDTINVVIGGVGGSVVLGHSTLIELDDTNTAKYSMDMSAQVADSNGNAVSGANVTLSLWPSAYYSGVWYDEDPDPNTKKCVPYYSGGPFSNEDIDEDLILDRPPASAVDEDSNQDGEATPHNSAAGTSPGTVTTDSKGIGAFKLTYLKQYAPWIDVRARARTKVQGTETTGTLPFGLRYLIADGEACIMPHSPFTLTLGGVLSVNSTQYAVEKSSGITYTVPNFADGTYDVYGTDKGTVVACSPSGSPVACVANYGKYTMPTSLPAGARSLNALYGAGYSTTTYEYLDRISVTDSATCSSTTFTCAGVSAAFPLRVLVDCSSTPGQGGCP